jgi:hypothetical protein
MTPEELFKASAPFRDGLKEFLESDIGKSAITILREKETAKRMPEVASMPPSERLHLYAQNQTFQAGWHECLRALHQLTLPMAEAATLPRQPSLQREFPKQPVTKA